MPQTPLPPGSVLVIEISDPNDPESALEVSLVKPTDKLNDYEWENLGNSFGAEARAQFLWMVRGCAAFHNLEVQMPDNLKVDE